MKKGYIIALVLIVAVVLVGAIIWMGQDEQEDGSATTSSSTTDTTDPADTENNGTAPAEGQVIVYTGTGFSPDTLTVSQGDTVTFRNESSTSVWPASDDHPTHTKLSGFDALRGLDQGEEYSYTFEETGEWGYHNHLNSVQTGTIIVE